MEADVKIIRYKQSDLDSILWLCTVSEADGHPRGGPPRGVLDETSRRKAIMTGFSIRSKLTD